MKKILYLAAFGLLLSTYGCKDDEPVDESTEPKTETNTDILTGGEWLMESGIIAPPVEVDIFGTVVTISSYYELLAAVNGGAVGDCQKDNLMIFHSDSTLDLDEGVAKCDPADPQVQDGGDWSFVNDETQLAFSSFPYDPLQQERVLDITELTKSDLKLEMDYRFGLPSGGDSTDHVIKLDFKNVK